MKDIIRIIKKVLPHSVVDYISEIHHMKCRYKYASYFTIIRRYKHIGFMKGMDITDEYVFQAKKAFSKIRIDTTSFFIYPFDQWIIRAIHKGVWSLASITVDYNTVLDSNIVSIKEQLSKDSTPFGKREIILIDSIVELSNRIIRELHKNKDHRSKLLEGYFETLLLTRPSSMDCALQKILFYNALCWQMRHWHNGLGRLDLVLYDYYKADIAAGTIDRNGAKELIKEFCFALGKNTDAKSLMLPGDTGQYILLGGVDKHGDTVQNELTEIFLEVFKENSFPDPKLILRVNNETSDTIWDKTVQCILTGNGSPLLMNERVVMKGMVEFGYNEDDVWNVGTSACWEPLVIGKSFDQNNALQNIPIITSLNDFIVSNQGCVDFKDFLNSYKPCLRKQIMSHIHDIVFDSSPLYSLFFDDCMLKKKDYTRGGAVYSYHGVQVVSFPNLINSLLNIKEFVFEKQYYSLSECSQAISSDFNGWDEMRNLFISNPHQFGSTDNDVVSLTKEMMLFMSDIVSELNVNGTKVKIGYSSSAYIEESRRIGATLDGRRAGDPFAVHISPVSQKIDIQEVIDFAGSLDYYNNRMNGNVVDFIVPTSFVRTPEKLKTILKASMDKGVFELQLNVLDAITLKDAKLHPEKYKGLIVRVWGFSAYFNELPEEYKDNIIKRAEVYV